MFPVARRKHPTLEGLRHSLMWIEERIKKETFEDVDRAQLVMWLKTLAKRVDKR